MKFKQPLLALCAVMTLTTACLKVETKFDLKDKKKKSSSVKNAPSTNTMIGDTEHQFQVISQSAFKSEIKDKSLISSSDAKSMDFLKSLPQGEIAQEKPTEVKEKVKNETLYVGIPRSLIGEQNIFGGVITKVSNKENENLGMLKLTDLEPMHVRTAISRFSNGEPALVLEGCPEQCDESSEQIPLLSIPIVGFNEEKGLVIIDLASVGQALDLATMAINGNKMEFKPISAETVSVDYDLKTLIFDIKTKLIPKAADASDPKAPVTEITGRWYLKLSSAFNPSFEQRINTEGVGFFETARSKVPKITRFSTVNKTIKYYIKNVPEDYQSHFVNAIESWNVELKKIVGRSLISYEFLESDDPRYEDIVPGDIRYNVIEWDLNNAAPYGGLGPSIANQYTGEILSANVLIQGPKIVQMYTHWFEASEKARDLMNLGQIAQANSIMKSFHDSVKKDIADGKSVKYQMKLGNELDMTVHSQRPDLEDPITRGNLFEILPRNMTFNKYMEGYMNEILAHELGHNLGLRHNFKGNLGAYESEERGSVSRSIMEYLGRPYRHLNAIGPYDRMAISYGYKGIQPKHKDWFCTDQDEARNAKTLRTASAECTKADATSDPFSFWENRLERILELVLDKKSNAAPVWKVKDAEKELNETVIGLSSYGFSAETTADTWINFFGKNDRPEDKKEIKGYVLSRIKNKICGPSLQEVIMNKESAEAQRVTQENLAELVKTFKDISKKLDAYSAEELDCAK